MLDNFVVGHIAKEDIAEAKAIIKAAGGTPKVSRSSYAQADYLVGWFPDGLSAKVRLALYDAIMEKGICRVG